MIERRSARRLRQLIRLSRFQPAKLRARRTHRPTHRIGGDGGCMPTGRVAGHFWLTTSTALWRAMAFARNCLHLAGAAGQCNRLDCKAGRHLWRGTGRRPMSFVGCKCRSEGRRRPKRLLKHTTRSRPARKPRIPPGIVAMKARLAPRCTKLPACWQNLSGLRAGGAAVMSAARAPQRWSMPSARHFMSASASKHRTGRAVLQSQPQTKPSSNSVGRFSRWRRGAANRCELHSRRPDTGWRWNGVCLRAASSPTALPHLHHCATSTRSLGQTRRARRRAWIGSCLAPCIGDSRSGSRLRVVAPRSRIRFACLDSMRRKPPTSPRLEAHRRAPRARLGSRSGQLTM